MDAFLTKVTQQAMNYAIRSGITITSGYALRQCGRLLKNVHGDEREELASLQLRLESKITIITPAIDMIELIAARGNTTLESAVTLTKTIRWEIQSLGNRFAKAAAEEELLRRGSSRAKPKHQAELERKMIASAIRKLLARIEDAVPLINLAITTSGANLSTSLPATVSPSRLLQASTFLTAGDTQYSTVPSSSVQIGPAFTLTMYMLFSGHAYRPHDEEGIRETTWKEVMHKARVKLLRVPLDKLHELPKQEGAGTQNDADSSPRESNGSQPTTIPAEGRMHEFAYQLLIIEDLDDDRVHTLDENEAPPESFEDVALAGLRELVPIHEISKIFYADTGKILNIGSDGEANSPILLLKRDVNAVPPRRMMERQTEEREWFADADANDEEDDQSHIDAQLRRESFTGVSKEKTASEERIKEARWRLPPDLDPEWIALEVYTEDPDTESDSEVPLDEPPSSPPSRSASLEPSLTKRLSNMHIGRNSSSPQPDAPSSPPLDSHAPVSAPNTPRTVAVQPSSSSLNTTLPHLRTSLSLLEMLIRLTALQQFQQTSHLAIPDELLTFFLSESASTGAGADAAHRRRVRRHARQRLGFDPYDESPVKLHGEDYQYGHYQEPGGWREGSTTSFRDGYDYDDGYGYGSGYDYYDNRTGVVDSQPGRSTTPLGPNAPIPSRERPTPPPSRRSMHSYPGGPAPSSLSPSARRQSPRLSRGMTPEARGQDSGQLTGTPSTPMSGRGRARGVPTPLGRGGVGLRSPLGRGVTADTDSTLGTSPSSEVLHDAEKK